MKLGITYAYYAMVFSKMDIEKLDNTSTNAPEGICNFLKITTNIFTDIHTKDSNTDTTLELPNYVHCKGHQNIQAHINQIQLCTIYQGLTKCISAKYGSSLQLHKLNTKYAEYFL